MTPKAVAQWMVDELQRDKVLHQEHVVNVIATKFGKEFLRTSENGNLTIDRRVLRAFRKLTADTVVWVKGENFWRLRTAYDPPGKRDAE